MRELPDDVVNERLFDLEGVFDGYEWRFIAGCLDWDCHSAQNHPKAVKFLCLADGASSRRALRDQRIQQQYVPFGLLVRSHHLYMYDEVVRTIGRLYL